MEINGKPYLVFIRLNPPQPEHAAIIPALESAACSPLSHLFRSQAGMVIAFRSTLFASQIADKITGPFHSGDSYILVELGSDGWAYHNDLARAWLKQNLN